ncbi:MAG: hypothetical protein WCP73_03210 [Eubacteriales bacterium]
MKQSKYVTNVEPKLKLIACWARRGVIDKDIAKKLDVAYSTFRDYAKEHTELKEALRDAKEVADTTVESSLFDTATGFTKTIKKAYKVKTVKYRPNGTKLKETEEVIYADEEIYIEPNPTAQIYWLSNRMPEDWKNKREDTLVGGDGQPIQVIFGIPRPDRNADKSKLPTKRTAKAVPSE